MPSTSSLRSIYHFVCRCLIPLTLALVFAPVTSQAQTAHFSYVFSPGPGGSGFGSPLGIAIDGSGNLYVADDETNEVSEIPANCSSTACVIPLGGGFYYPAGVAVDKSGNVYVGDYGNNAVKEMTPGCASSTCVTSLGGGFKQPESVAVDNSGNVYVADSGNSAIKEMTAGCASTACVTTLGAGFFQPLGVAVDQSNNVFVADTGNNQVEKMTPGCTSLTCVTVLGGAGVNSAFAAPAGVTVDQSGNVFVADGGNERLAEIPSGCTASSCVVQVGPTLQFSDTPYSLVLDSNGNIDFAAPESHAVLALMLKSVNLFSESVGLSSAPVTLTFTFGSTGTIEAPAVLTQGAPNLDFTDNGTGTCTTNGSSHTYNSGDTCTVDVKFTPQYAGQRLGAVVLKNSSGTAIATVPVFGTGNASEIVFSPSAISTLGGGFSYPYDAAVDAGGNVYVADWGNNAVKEIPAGCATSACIETLGGGFDEPTGVAVDGGGNVYVADATNSVVTKMPAGCASSACVTAVGGGFSAPLSVAVDGRSNVYVADDKTNAVTEMPAGCASISCVTPLGGGFSAPRGVTVDGAGNVYVAELAKPSLKKIPPGCTSSACVTLLGGGLSSAENLAVDGSGNVYVADYSAGEVKKIPPGCTSSACVTVLGAGFEFPNGVAVDGGGNVFVADYGHSAIKEIQRATPPSLSFATTQIGLKSSDSPQSFTVENIGNQTLFFPVPSSGTNPSVSSNFLWDSASTCQQTNSSSTTAFSLAEGTSCNIAIDFEPSTAGNISGSVVLSDNSGAVLADIAPPNSSGAPTQTIPLSGIGFTPPSLTSPTSSPLAGGTKFTWNPGAGSSMFALWVGTSPGTYNIYTSGHVANTVTSETVTIPANGATLYVSLWYELDGAWSSLQYTFYEGGPPVLTSPSSSPVGGPTKFAWNPGSGSSMFALWIGTTQGTYNIYTSGHVANTVTSETVTIPANGAKLWVRLWYEAGSAWDYKDYTFTEAQTPALTSPTSSPVSGSIKFAWSAGTGSSMFALWIGTTQGSSNIYTSGHVANTVTSETVTIPANGATIWVRLWYEVGSNWLYRDYTFTEAP